VTRNINGFLTALHPEDRMDLSQQPKEGLRSMKHQRMTPKAVPWVVLACLALASPVAAQSTEDVTYSWTAPTEGSPVVYYVIEHSVNGGPFVQIGTSTSNTYTLAATLGDTHQIRVAGVDALDRMGPFSEASDPYAPQLGPPGQPGQPIPIF